ncbi:MAG TPA: DUF1573 domain-containing protein [Phycisphaerae bacterium]|nr:DUF1573 domain-containing protein [Phycisphaerae bacterium]
MSSWFSDRLNSTSPSRRMQAGLAFCTAAILTAAAMAAPEGAAGAQAAPAQTQPAGPLPKARCDQPEYNWGQAWGSDKVEHTFIIANDGDAVLTLEARPSCGCTVAEYDKTVAPGGQGKVKTILTLPNANQEKMSKAISVITNDPTKQTLALTLVGAVKQKISSDPPLFAYFGQLTPGLNLTKTFKITNNTDQPMKLELVPPAAPSCFKVEIKELEPGKTAEVIVTAEPPFKDDTNAAQFTIKTGIEGVADLSLPCNLIKPPPVQVTPSALRLPPVPLQTQSRQTVVVRNNTEAPVQIISAEANDPAIKTEVKESSPGKVWVIQIEAPVGFNPEPGKSPTLTITTDYKDKPVYTVPMIPAPSTPRPPTTAPALVNADSLIGAAAPVPAISTTDGRQIQLGASNGQVKLVNFWASWCTPSRTQVTLLDQLYQTYRRRGVEFINVSVDRYRPADELEAVRRALDSKIPLALDPERRLTRAFGVSEAPTLFLIGKNGIIEAVRRGVGRTDRDLEMLSQIITEQLDALLEGKTRTQFTPRPVSIGMTCRLEQITMSPLAASGAFLSVDALSQDAGLFKPKTKGEFKLYFRNDGAQPLEIKDIQASPGLTIEPGYPTLVASKATAFVTCSFETSARPEQFMHYVTFHTNGANPTVKVTIVGRVRPYIELQPVSGIDFSNRARTFSVPRIATLIYNGPGEIEYKKATSSSPKFEPAIDVRRPDIAILTVYPKPPFEPGENNAIITIETNQPEQPTVQVPVKLFMPKRIEVTPATVQVPPTRTVYQTQVSITNSGTTSLDILGIDKSNPEIQTQFYPEPDGLSYKLQLTFPPNFSAGPEGETVTVRTSDSEFAKIVIPIRGGAGPRMRGSSPQLVSPAGRPAAPAAPQPAAPAAGPQD